ncbi:hypothetical protein BCR42DRAFT_126931 [Absidia repens]|uniref:K Homology domain-containing protein n=1 Tax=Absidia repens TaxID=90262 RepID=A0A1X2IV95_9FUNG|nr:hypothetical protein BCR42DRAFT_126931 [Absidia repens]
MNENDISDSTSTDRFKRPRFEEEVDTDIEYHSKEDRHPKRQAIPDPETKAPRFAGEEQMDTGRDSKKWTEADPHSTDDGDTNTELDHAGDFSAPKKTIINPYDSGNTLTLKNPNATITVRSLVNSKDAGVIIGRAGKSVNEIRQHSSSYVTISDIVYGVYDRILTVKGSVEAVAKAYAMVSEKILTEKSSENQDNKQQGDANIRLLVPDIRMGSLIGRSGSIIKSVQEESGAHMNASEEILVMSTERIMTIIGAPKSIYIAVARIGDILADLSQRPLPGYIPYTPIAAKSSLPPLNRRTDYSSRGGHGGVSSNIDTGGGVYGMIPGMLGRELPGIPMGWPFIYQNQNFGGGSPNYGTMNNSQSQQILIPNDMVGCIIGKNGSKINEIRQVSGSHIKIMNAAGNTNERLVTITGSHESNQMAMYMLCSRFESEKFRFGMM